MGMGLAAGALLAEGGLLVPFWQSMEPSAFLVWYERYASLLMGFFTPLEVIPTLLILFAAIEALRKKRPVRVPLGIACFLAVAVLASFPLYFQGANASFASGSIDVAHIGAELQRWATWHWGRTVLAILGFAIAASALSGDWRAASER